MPSKTPSATIVDYETTMVLARRRRTLRTNPQFSVQLGLNPTVLVVAFTGFNGNLSMSPFNFMRTAELLSYSRILLCDTSKTCYLNGIPPIATGIDALVDLLREHIARLAPKHTMFIGSSGGSHAATLFGHLLGADLVHAFSPHTNLDPDYWRSSEPAQEVAAFADAMTRVEAVAASVRACLDLRKVLQVSNGKTRYNLHVCAQSAVDVARAVRLEGLPGVVIHRHPCDHHRVAVWLARERRLLTLLKIDGQPAPAGADTIEPAGAA